MDKKKDILKEKIIVINVGLKEFSDSLQAQNIKTVLIDWSPPKVDKEILNLLELVRIFYCLREFEGQLFLCELLNKQPHLCNVTLLL